MDNLDRITVNPEVCLGQSTIRNMRITARVILKMLGSGRSAQDVVAAYPKLDTEDVQQALRYAAWLASEQLRLTSAAQVTLRLSNSDPDRVSARLLTVLRQVEAGLRDGCAVTVEDTLVRIRPLPIL